MPPNMLATPPTFGFEDDEEDEEDLAVAKDFAADPSFDTPEERPEDFFNAPCLLLLTSDSRPPAEVLGLPPEEVPGRPVGMWCEELSELRTSA